MPDIGSQPAVAVDIEVIAAQLLDLLQRPYDAALLPPLDDDKPIAERAPCQYARTLRLEGIRMEVLRVWSTVQKPWSSDPAEVRQAVDSLTGFIEKYLRGWGAQLSDLAAGIKAQLLVLLSSKDEPGPAILRPIVFPDEPGFVPDDDLSGSCPYSSLLCLDSVRPLILDAWKKEHARDGKKPSPKTRQTLQAADKLLRQIFPIYRDLIDVHSIAHRTTHARLPEHRIDERQSVAKAVLGAERVQVKMLQNCGSPRRYTAKGQRAEVTALEFLEAAHQYALNPAPQNGPPFEADGNTHAARRAKTCWAILAFLGDRRRAREHLREPYGVGRNELALHVCRTAQGNAYVKVQKFTVGLHALGMVAIEQLDDRHSVTITRKIVKYLRSNSAVH